MEREKEEEEDNRSSPREIVANPEDPFVRVGGGMEAQI